jgi:hypothetical protein
VAWKKGADLTTIRHKIDRTAKLVNLGIDRQKVKDSRACAAIDTDRHSL